jgi:hypothetical protein
VGDDALKGAIAVAFHILPNLPHDFPYDVVKPKQLKKHF